MSSTQITVNAPMGDVLLFTRFEQGLLHENRFLLDDDVKDFVDDCVAHAQEHRSHIVSQGTKLYRARVRPDDLSSNSNTLFPICEMGAPPKSKATAGRLNPEGIPYLYTASDEYTAIAEVRPWKRAYVTVGQIEVSKGLQVVDLARPQDAAVETDEPSGAAWTWDQLISGRFAVPHSPHSARRYVPTQYLAESFKRAGFDGVMYRSALSERGHNIAIFDPSQAPVVKNWLAVVRSVDYKHELVVPKVVDDG